MKRTSLFSALMLVGLLAAMFTGNVFSQDQGDQRRRRFDREAFRQRLAERMKEALNVNEEEWAVMEPIIQKINGCRADANAGGWRFFGFGRGRRGGADGGDREESLARTKSRELGELLQAKDAAADDIKAKLAELRETRLAVKKQLDTARQELGDIVTQRQEATLVLMGVLD